MKTLVTSAEIVILAEGDQGGSQANARGHLFEQFVAQLMALFGYAKPERVDMNVSSNGIELDVSSKHVLTQQRMIAECKAYSTPLPAKELSSFYGKLGAERFDEAAVFGYFLALPRLTSQGTELAAKYEANDPHFRVYTADGVMKLLLERAEVLPFATVASAHQPAVGPLSDEVLLVTPDGLFYAAHELQPETRLPARVLVYGAKSAVPIPSRVLELLSDTTSYTKGLQCVAAATTGTSRVEKVQAPEDTVIEVTGSSSDFEYQFPAAPKYFVGRQAFVARGHELLNELGRMDSRAQVVVFNAQSGWGKSSLALRMLAAARALGGDGVCIDCRTATQATFVSAGMRHAFVRAEKLGLLTLPADASFGTVASALQTLKLSRFAERKPLCLFFDQFENVFQNPALTREFRDLALGVIEVQAPLLLGFSWKTDFVAFTESYPYQLRDDIRSRATVLALSPFGPSETGELFTRLQRSCGQKIHPYLRERIREYSQGLPWLFKKLGSHLISEISRGTSQDQLLSEVLNIQSLFESDISGLNVNERETLRAIARRAPVSVVEATDLASGNKDVLQSLLNQRLLVSIGEKLDVYWDVFRDYLNQGSVPLQDSYILRLTPNSTSKLLIAIQKAGGSTTTDEVAKALNTSNNSVLNAARDLRQLGILAAREGVLRFSDEIAAADDVNGAIVARATTVLRRHRVYSLLTSLAGASGRLPLSSFASELPKVYPAVEANRTAWAGYSRAFAYWFQFAGLVSVDRDELVVGERPSEQLNLFLPGKKRALRTLPVFPRSPFQPVMRLLAEVAAANSIVHSSAVGKAIGDAKLLGLITAAEDGTLSLTPNGELLNAAPHASLPELVRNTISAQPAFKVALPRLEENPGASPLLLGRALAAEMGIDWSDETASWAGKYIRIWMRAAGVATRMR